MHISANILPELKEAHAQIQEQGPMVTLAWIAEKFPGLVTFSTSFGIEDQIIAHLIFSQQLPIEVFTLDTGRQFTETYSTWTRTLERYGQPISVYAPKAESLEHMLTTQGPNGFYESVEKRKQCCQVRKVEPLERALAGKKLWITGIRAEQSANRQHMSSLEWDDSHQLLKFHPLFDWPFEQVKSFVKEHKVPYNALHDKGFVSIGCAPCTRAITPGEDFRAGRWWWEDASKKECGLHQAN